MRAKVNVFVIKSTNVSTAGHVMAGGVAEATTPLFGLFLGSFENWRVGASEPVPVPATTQPINPCRSVNPRQSLIIELTFLHPFPSN